MQQLRKIIFIFSFFIFLSSLNCQTIKSLPIPSFVDFAKQKILLDRYDMRERFDREQIIIAYSHSTSILLLKRANRYFPIIEPILKKNGIPDDFKYLAVIESSLDPRAISPMQAAGLWQMLPKTAEQFGLEVNEEVDERYHIEKETEAACKYLRSAFAKYNSWTTVAVSYNAGMGKISGEQEKQQVIEAFDMLLSQESSRYMFRILAIKQFIEHPLAFGYMIEREHLYHNIGTKIVVVKDSIIDWTIWANKYGLSYSQLKDFNIWLRATSLKNRTGKEYQITLPNIVDLKFSSSKIKQHISLANDILF